MLRTIRLFRTIRRRLRWFASDAMAFIQTSITRLRMVMFWTGFYAGHALLRWAWRRAVIVRAIPPSERERIIPTSPR